TDLALPQICTFFYNASFIFRQGCECELFGSLCIRLSRIEMDSTGAHVFFIIFFRKSLSSQLVFRGLSQVLLPLVSPMKNANKRPLTSRMSYFEYLQCPFWRSYKPSKCSLE
uniref:Ovule protein n=2 Tax=Mesocestoides corti TaxID=53468 RepID=A0A5K3F0G8_MESCO